MEEILEYQLMHYLFSELLEKGNISNNLNISLTSTGRVRGFITEIFTAATSQTLSVITSVAVSAIDHGTFYKVN